MPREKVKKPFPTGRTSARKELTSNCAVYIDRPDSKVFMEEGLVRFDNTNLIVQQYACQDTAEAHHGPLSIMFSARGQDEYQIDGRRFVVDETAYLIQNLGQSIVTLPTTDPSAESYLIGFWPGFAEDVLRGLVTPADQLLDYPKPSWGQSVRFFNQTYRHDHILSPLLFRIRTALATDEVTHGWLEEQNHLLIEAMLHVHRDIGREIENLPAIRASTRAEYYQRLNAARDFMEAGLNSALTLPAIAAAACLSPHHFLRLFKQVFKETPHQYLTRRRMERAQRLLLQTEDSITDICFSVGFESLGSFSWLFRKKTGYSPEQFRNYHRKHDSLK